MLSPSPARIASKVTLLCGSVDTPFEGSAGGLASMSCNPAGGFHWVLLPLTVPAAVPATDDEEEGAGEDGIEPEDL